MNNSKILMIIVGTLLGICVCVGAAGFLLLRGAGWVITETVEGDAATVATVGEGIADYTLPAGFDDGYAVSLGGYEMVTYTAVSGRSHIYLIQGPASLTIDRDTLARQAREASGADAWREVQTVEERPCQIRGQASTLVISEGVSHDGMRYRTASALFDGKAGPAMVSLSAPADSWDQAMVDSFIASLN